MRICVIFSPAWVHEEKASARLSLLFISRRSVSRLYQTVWIAEGVSRTREIPVITIYAYHQLALSCVRSSVHRSPMRTDTTRTGISMRISCRAKVSGYRVHGIRRGISSAARREEFFEFFAWFANTAGIYSNTSIRSGNILTRRNFDSRA